VESSADVTSKLAHYLGLFFLRYVLYTKNPHFQHIQRSNTPSPIPLSQKE